MIITVEEMKNINIRTMNLEKSGHLLVNEEVKLDGHRIGSIGEVMAAQYHGIELYRASASEHCKTNLF